MSHYKRTHNAPQPEPDQVPHEYRADAEKLKELFPNWTTAGTPFDAGLLAVGRADDGV